MGYERQAPAPSPLQMLSIFQAKTKGIPLCEIAARTKFSMSTLIRWWTKWGHEYSIFMRMMEKDTTFLNEHNFDSFYPDVENKGPQAHVEEADGTVRYLGNPGHKEAEALATQDAAD